MINKEVPKSWRTTIGDAEQDHAEREAAYAWAAAELASEDEGAAVTVHRLIDGQWQVVEAVGLRAGDFVQYTCTAT